jgi:hypothetical protein
MTGLKKLDRRVWVDCDNSLLPKAVILYWCNHIGMGGGFAIGSHGRLWIGGSTAKVAIQQAEMNVCGDVKKQQVLHSNLKIEHQDIASVRISLRNSKKFPKAELKL